jgi:dicarboxylate transporter 10
MCADGAKPVADRFAYPNGVLGLYRVGRDEGVSTFGRGVTANIARSVLMNVGQIATYSAAKHQLLHTFGLKDDVKTHAIASLGAGTVATTICAPADVLKSRIQSATAAGLGGSVSFRCLKGCDGRVQSNSRNSLSWRYCETVSEMKGRGFS